MPTRNINLTDHFDRFVADQVRTGRYKNASEVLRAGLHLLEQQSREGLEKLALLRTLAQEGFVTSTRGRASKSTVPGSFRNSWPAWQPQPRKSRRNGR